MTVSRARPRALAGILAVLAAVLVWLVARVAGVDLLVAMDGKGAMVIGLPLVVVISLVAVLAGWASLTALERLTRRADTAWLFLAFAVLAVSFFPVATAESSGGTRLTLALMHLAVAAVLIPGLRRPSGEREAEGKESP